MQTLDGLTPLRYEFELPSRDQVRASRYMSHRQWGTWAAYLLFGGAGLFIFGASVVFELKGRHVNWITTAPTVAACFAMLFVFLLPNYLVYRMRKDLPIHQGPHKWTMTPGVGLAVASPSTSASPDVPAWLQEGYDRTLEADEAPRGQLAAALRSFAPTFDRRSQR